AEMRAARPDVPVFVVANKCDLPHHAAPEHLPMVAAAADDQGVDTLVARLQETTEAGVHAEGSPVVTNRRHRAHIACAAEALTRAQRALRAGSSGDVLAADL